jgi:copper chaperone CopZ
MKQIILVLTIVLSIVSCAPKQAPKEKEVPAVMVETTLRVEGMTCTECEQSVAKGVNELAGIDSISANHLDSTAFVRFDSNKTNLDEIKKAIEGRGYEVVASAK